MRGHSLSQTETADSILPPWLRRAIIAKLFFTARCPPGYRACELPGYRSCSVPGSAASPANPRARAGIEGRTRPRRSALHSKGIDCGDYVRPRSSAVVEGLRVSRPRDCRGNPWVGIERALRTVDVIAHHAGPSTGGPLELDLPGVLHGTQSGGVRSGSRRNVWRDIDAYRTAATTPRGKVKGRRWCTTQGPGCASCLMEEACGKVLQWPMSRPPWKSIRHCSEG